MVKSKGIKLQFPEGEKCYLGVGNHKLVYILNCEKNVEVQFERIEKISTCVIEYYFNTKYACQEFAVNNDSNNIAVDSKMLLMVLGVVFTIYCIGFTFVNMRNYPEEGLIKNLPHREFWSNLFEYSIHGCSVSSNLIMSKIFKIKPNNYDYV